MTRCVVKWLRYCCCCFCCELDGEEKSVSEASSAMIRENRANREVQPFYVPRRHSSFQPRPTSTVSARPGLDTVESCSSSEEEGGTQSRGRCWSSIPDSHVRDISALINDNMIETEKEEILCEVELPTLSNRHVLSEISEQAEWSASAENATRTEEYLGRLTFSVSYSKEDQRLYVFLAHATDLPKKEDFAYKTFVKLSLLSSAKIVQISTTAKNTLSPVFREEFTIKPARSDWKTNYPNHLRLSVYDNDRQGKLNAIGHVLLPFDKMSDELTEHTKPLTPMSMPVQNLGYVLVSLNYKPTQSRLTVHVIRSKQLRLDPDFHKRYLTPINRDVITTFCKTTLICSGQKVKTFKCAAVAGADAFYDHKSRFIVPPQYLRDSTIIVTVVVRSALGRRGITLGRTASIGPYIETADGKATHWGRMAQELRQVVMWRDIYL